MKSSRSKSQTRLNFSPLSSSSPQSSKYPTQIREGAAAITYGESPSPAKRRKFRDHEGTSGGPGGLATPKNSSQIQDFNSDSDSEPVRMSSRKTLNFRGGRQSKEATSDATKKGTLSSPLRSARTSVGIFGAKDIPVSLSSEGDSSPSTEGPPNTLRRNTLRSQANKSKKGDTGMSTAERITRRKASAIAPELQSEGGHTPSTKRHGFMTLDGIGEAETSGDEIIVQPLSTGRSLGPSRSRRPRKRADGLDDFIVNSESSSDVHIVSERSKQKRVEVISDEESRQDEIEDESGSEDGDEEDMPITPQKRRIHRDSKARTPRDITQQEREDLEEDLEFLQSSDDDGPGPNSRTRIQSEARKKQSVRTKALETLKRRRASQRITISDTDNEDEDTEIGNQNDETVDFGNEYNSEDLDHPSAYQRANGMPSSSATAMFEEDEYDEGFVIDDEDTLGAPSSALPIEFSGYSSRKPKELFKFAVEWFVQRKFNPAFQTDDEIYHLTFNKLNDEVKGLVGSKFMSAAWTADFTRAVQARPYIEAHELPKGSGFLHDKCDACNRTGHPASWRVRFTGKPYHEETLEEVEQDNDDEDDNSDDSDDEHETADVKVDYDSKGHLIPSTKKAFEVGKFCMQNARVGHALNHWRYHLNEWVIDYLRDEGYLSAEKIVERDGWSTRRRRDFANSVVDEMEERDEIKRLYRDYRHEIDSAREAKAADRFIKS